MMKLTTNPWSPDIADGRKVLRSRNKQALDMIGRPVGLFWIYDDRGEQDPELEIWAVEPEPGINGFTYRSSSYWGSFLLNVPCQFPVYTLPPDLDLELQLYARHLDIRAILLPTRNRSRGMTFWVFGMKIHVLVRYADLVTEPECFVAGVDISPDRRVTVNGVDRGILPGRW